MSAMPQQISDDIPPRLYEADRVLTAYARWAQSRGGARTCGSLEGKYRPSGVEAMEARRTPYEQVLSAVERVASQRALARVPEEWRQVLVILYLPQGRAPTALLRTAGIAPRTCRERHLPALQMWWNLYRVQL